MAGGVGGWTAVPVRLTACGLPGALSMMSSEALNDPAEVGAKDRLIAQLAPGWTLVPQFPPKPKGWGLVPPMVMFEMISGALPVFETVTDWNVAPV
jgi:hypothetical protein